MILAYAPHQFVSLINWPQKWRIPSYCAFLLTCLCTVAFCGAEGLSNVITLSTLRNNEFLKNYGVEIVDGPLKGLAARAVIVLDENDNVIFSQLVDEITHEPDYDAALNVLKA